MGKKRTFLYEGTPVDVDDSAVNDFLSKFPKAEPMESFVLGNDTVDVPASDISVVKKFKQQYPDAKPLFGEEQPQEIPTITLDSTEVAEGTAEAPKPPTGPLKPGGGFTIGKTPTLTKQTKDVFVKNFLELPDNLKLDARNSGVFVNTFAKKMNLSPRELRQVANETVKTEVQLKQLKTVYDQNPDDTDTLYKLAELHNNLGQHDLAYEAYAALEGKLKTIGEKEASDPNNPNKRPDYVEQRQLPAVAGMAYTQELLGNKAEAQRLKGISESRGYKGQEFSSVGAGEALQPGNDMVYNDQGQMVPVGSPTPESEYLNGIAQAIENFTLFGPANEMTNVGFDKLAKNLPGAFDPYGLPSDKIAKTVGVITGAVETLMGVAGMTTPAGALFAMPLVEVQNVAPEVAKWMMPIGVVLNEYYRQQGEKMPEMMENVTVLADLGMLGWLTHQGVEGAKGLKAEIDLKKVFENLPPEAVEQLAKVGEKRIEMAQGDPKVYGEQMALRLDELKPQVEEIKMQAEAAKPVEPYNPPPHPESLRTVEEGSSIIMNGEEGILERSDDGSWNFTTDKKSTQIPVADKFNPTETLKELGIEVLAEITPEQVARATADAEQVGRVEMNGKEYFVSLDRVGNENPTGDFVLEVKPDGTMINRFDSHPDPTFAKERKLKVINTFLESKGLPKRDKLTSTKLVEETPTQEQPSTLEIKPIENEKVNQEGRQEGLLDTPPLEQPLAPVAEKPTPNEPVSPAVEVQIEDFGVPKSDVGAVKSLLDNVFAGLKKAGLTAFKTLDEWIGIGKGEAKEYSLKINGKEVKVKNTSTDVVNGFYSPLEKTISETKFDKLPTKQWLEKFGKGEEAKWTGLTEWLSQQEGTVSKAEIQQYLKDNRIQVVEVVKGMDDNQQIKRGEEIKQSFIDEGYEIAAGMDGEIEVTKDGEYVEDIESDLPKNLYNLAQEYYDLKSSDGRLPINATKFSQYQLEGQKENYKEVLVTMPSKKVVGEAYHIIRDKYLIPALKEIGLERSENALRRMKIFSDENRMREFENDADYSKAKEALLKLQENGKQDIIDKYFDGFEYNKKVNELRKNEFKSFHWDEPNILVHLRMNTRIDAQGKKVLFQEEVQSDWGQTGKKEGFKEPSFEWDTQLGKDAVVVLKKMNETAGFNDWKGLATAMAKSNDILNDFQVPYDSKDLMLKWHKAVNQERKVPSAPFVTDTNAWTKLGLKVALKEAVKQGADKIAWTTGEQQNERYDLSKQVQSIEVEKVKDVPNLFFVDINMLNETATYNLEVENGVVREGTYKGQRLEDVVGKDVAEKILNGGSQTLRGDNLKVGGKGMKGFYGSPTEGTLGIVGNVAKSLFKQEPKTTTLQGEKPITTDNTTVEKGTKSYVLKNENGDSLATMSFETGDNFSKKDLHGELVFLAKKYAKKEVQETTQHSIDITPELKASVEGGQPLFKGSQAQYHIQSGKNIIEAIKNFNGSKKATVAITHEIMHPTVVAIIDGAKSGVEKGIKHTDTIVSEYNKAKRKNITAQELIEGNDAFKEGETSDTYRAVQEFIADSWEKYHREGGKGFSESFQKVLEQITQAFTDVYKTLKGKELTPELRKMFDEILGKEPEPVKVKEPRVESEIETKVRELKQDVLNIGYEIGHEMEKNSLAEFSPDMYAVQNMPWIKPESAAKETGGRVGSKGDISPSMTNASKGVTVSRAGEILANRASEDGLHPFLDSEDWRAIVIDILHAGSKESYVKNNTKFGKERTRALKQDMAEKKAELAEAIKDLENADWEKLGFDSKKEFKQHVRDIKQGKQIEQYEMDAMDVVAQMDDAAVDRMLKELDENYPITEEEINKFYEKHNIEEGSVSAEVSSPKIAEGNTAEGKAQKTGEGELTPAEPLKITSKEKALKAVDDLESFLLNLPGVKDNTGAERMGAPFKMEDAVKFFAEALREGVEQGYKVKEAIERAIGKLKEHKTYKALLDSVDESMLRDNARKNYEKQGVSLDKPIEQQFGASHASVAEVRKVMGLTDEINITDAHKRDTKTVMKEGKQIAESSNVQFLADDIISGEKIPNAQEQAALVYEQTKLYNESLDYQDRIDSFTEKGELNAADQATIELANIRARQRNVMDALDIAGTKMGLAFRMRQLINKRDHSLVALEKRWTSASGGNEITPSVRKQLEARVKELEAEVKKSEELFKAKDKELADQAMLDIQEALAREKTSPLQRIKAEKKIRKEELAQKFRGVFNDATNIAKAMVDKEFYEYARLVLEEAVGDFKEFSKRMIGDLGKNVEPHLQEIFDKASKKEYEKAFVDEVKGIQIDKQIIRDIVEQGVKDSQELVDKVFDAVKDDLPEGTSRREVQDAISEYGKQINPKIDPLQAEINSLKRDLKLESGLEDATSGKGVKRSGFTQPKPTPKQRGLKRRINEELKNYPQDQAEINKKWATALDRTKTALNNSITDLTKRLDDLKQGIATAKTPKERVKLDTDAQALKDMRDDLVKQIEEIEGKKKLSYEQRVILAIEAAERTAQKYKNRTKEIKKTGTYSKDTPTQLSSPELDIARAKRDAAQAEFNQASKDANLDVIAATSKALRDSQDRVAKLEQKVRSNDISYAQRAVRLAIETPELKASKAAEKALRDIIDTMREEQGVAELHRMELWKNRAANRLKELERRVREKDYSKKVKKETPIDMEMERTAMKIDRAKFDLDVAIEVERYKNLQGWEKAGETISDIFNIPKSIMASMDISAPFRQGAVLFARHPILGAKATKEMFKHLWSEKEANDWNDRLRLSDGYIRAKKSNLFISEPMARLVASEERFMSHIAEKIPVLGRGVKASNRAYSGFLNKIRTDVFNQHYEALVNEGFSGKELQSELSQMAHLINNFSGRGKLGKRGELASPLLNAAFFAPRYVTSRINTLANAVTGYWLEGRAYGSQRMSTRTRIEAYKALGAYVTVGVGVLQMAKAAGAEVEIDPRSSDFGKIKIGDLRYDIWAGFQQEIVLLARIFTQAKVDVFNGKVKKFNEGFGSSNTGSTVGNFLRSKASPQVGYALSAMTGTTMGMEEFDAGKELLRMSVPLLLQDPIANLIYNDAVSMYKEGDAGFGTFAAGATGVGVGYIPKPKAVEGANLNEKSLNLMIEKQYKPQDYKDDEVYVKGKPYIIPEDKMVKIKEMRAKEAGKLIELHYWKLKKLTPEEYESKVNSYYNEGLKKARNKYLPSGWKNTK